MDTVQGRENSSGSGNKLSLSPCSWNCGGTKEVGGVGSEKSGIPHSGNSGTPSAVPYTFHRVRARLRRDLLTADSRRLRENAPISKATGLDCVMNCRESVSEFRP